MEGGEWGGLGGFWWRVIAQSPHMDTTLLYSEVGYRFYFLVTFCHVFFIFLAEIQVILLAQKIVTNR